MPEFHAVALGVGDPGEVTVGVGLAVEVAGDAGGGELGEQGFEVVDAVVDDGGLGSGAKVRGVGGEKRPGGAAGADGEFVGPQEDGAAPVGELDAEVLGVPGGESLGGARFEEDAANAGNACRGVLLDAEKGYGDSGARRYGDFFNFDGGALGDDEALSSGRMREAIGEA